MMTREDLERTMANIRRTEEMAAEHPRLKARIEELEKRNSELEKAVELNSPPPPEATDAFKEATHAELVSIAARLSQENTKLRAEVSAKTAHPAAAGRGLTLTERAQAALEHPPR